jgi:serine/threonine protein kinase
MNKPIDPKHNALPTESKLNGGRYVVQDTLGVGGFGITYRASDTRLKRSVAIKELYPDGCEREGSTITLGGRYTPARWADAVNRFLGEAQRLAAMRHPGIVEVHDFFEENNTAYMVMRFIEGLTLAERVKQRPALREEEVLRYAGEVGDALHALHKRGVLHRDVKPGNIILSTEDEDRPVLVDLGAAREVIPSDADSDTTSYTAIGTAGFRAPEQAVTHLRQGSYTDVYGLAATVFYLITGKLITRASTRDREKLSPNLQAALGHALSTRPKDRPQDMPTFIRELRGEIEPPGDAMETWDELLLRTFGSLPKSTEKNKSTIGEDSYEYIESTETAPKPIDNDSHAGTLAPPSEDQNQPRQQSSPPGSLHTLSAPPDKEVTPDEDDGYENTVVLAKGQGKSGQAPLSIDTEVSAALSSVETAPQIPPPRVKEGYKQWPTKEAVSPTQNQSSVTPRVPTYTPGSQRPSHSGTTGYPQQPPTRTNLPPSPSSGYPIYPNYPQQQGSLQPYADNVSKRKVPAWVLLGLGALAFSLISGIVFVLLLTAPKSNSSVVEVIPTVTSAQATTTQGLIALVPTETATSTPTRIATSTHTATATNTITPLLQEATPGTTAPPSRTQLSGGITHAQMSTQLQGGEPGDNVSTYNVSDPFNLAVQATFGADAVTSITTRWYDTDGIQIYEMRKVYSQPGIYYTGFTLGKSSPWTPGTYRVDIYTNDSASAAYTVTFSVVP